ncbi:hypothetical protein CDS [Bradyrhizobium sp.]|nr:hypothetical protein CDS [Bradyrhizobium sp.]
MIGGKVESDAAAERDRHPWQQPPGAGLGARPFAQGPGQRRPEVEPSRREAARGCSSADGPSPRNPSPRDPLGPNWPARLRHSLHLTIRDRPGGYRNVRLRE